MNTRTIFAFLVLLVALIVGAIVWAHFHNKSKNESKALPVLTVSALNQTKNTAATAVTATPGDVIVFTLSAENQTDQVIPGYVMEANISDLAANSTLTDANGASYNSATNSLVWTPLDISPGESIQKKIAVRVNALPAGATSGEMKMKFNNEITVNVAAKAVASSNNSNNGGVVAGSQDYKAPVTGASENLLVALAAAATLAFWFIRRSKLAKN